MSVIHFLNVLEGDCNIIRHDNGHVTVIDVSNAYNDFDTEEEKEARSRKEVSKSNTGVPKGLKDFGQKGIPDNPILYLKHHVNAASIFRFIITHPDMDHLDGIKDLFEEFKVYNTWDTDNTKSIDKNGTGGPYNIDDWKFYSDIRDGRFVDTKRLTLNAGDAGDFWDSDNIKVLCPTLKLVEQANNSGKDYHDLSYVLLYTPPKAGGGHWKIVFAGDSHDASWDYIIKNYRDAVSNVDVLFAPHHGRDSDRDYCFLDILKPKLTLFGNAASEHLAYSSYKRIRITNNQAGYVILNVTPDSLKVFTKNKEFADWFRDHRLNWGPSWYEENLKAYYLCQWNA